MTSVDEQYMMILEYSSLRVLFRYMDYKEQVFQRLFKQGTCLIYVCINNTLGPVRWFNR